MMLTYEELQAEVERYKDPGDLYESSYSLFFDIAEYLYVTNPDMIPDNWKFQPGLSFRFFNLDNPLFDTFENTDLTNLVKLGNELSQFIDQCKKDGTDY